MTALTVAHLQSLSGPFLLPQLTADLNNEAGLNPLTPTSPVGPPLSICESVGAASSGTNQQGHCAQLSVVESLQAAYELNSYPTGDRTLQGGSTRCFEEDPSRANDENPEAPPLPSSDALFMQKNLEMCRHVLRTTFEGSQVFQNSVYLDEHAPVFTVAQATKLCPHRDGVASMKNLFFKDKKKQLFLLSALADTEIRINDLPFGAKKGLSFASSDLLREKLGLIPGSVTPFGLLNDKAGEVCFYLDARAVTEYTFLAFHPNSCAATLTIHKEDFVRFIEEVTRHKVRFVVGTQALAPGR